jgi:hypothetical protein
LQYNISNIIGESRIVKGVRLMVDFEFHPWNSFLLPPWKFRTILYVVTIKVYSSLVMAFTQPHPQPPCWLSNTASRRLQNTTHPNPHLPCSPPLPPNDGFPIRSPSLNIASATSKSTHLSNRNITSLSTKTIFITFPTLYFNQLHYIIRVMEYPSDHRGWL